MTSAILILDTNVISEAMRPAPAPTVMSWLSRKPEDGHFFVTTVTMAEILYGVELLPRGKRHDNMLVQAVATFAEDFAGRVLPFDEDAAQAFAAIAASRRRQGRPITDLDAQIAAITRSRGAILATRNTSDFEGCGIRLVNPWLG